MIEGLCPGNNTTTAHSLEDLKSQWSGDFRHFLGAVCPGYGVIETMKNIPKYHLFQSLHVSWLLDDYRVGEPRKSMYSGFLTLEKVRKVPNFISSKVPDLDEFTFLGQENCVKRRNELDILYSKLWCPGSTKHHITTTWLHNHLLKIELRHTRVWPLLGFSALGLSFFRHDYVKTARRGFHCQKSAL